MDTTLLDPLVGRLLEGRYRVEGRVARGGMASVYTATDVRLERTVAVKVMHPALADDADFIARFTREAHAAARLSHPNVVAVFDQGADADCVFLVMEYVPGRTLRDLLRARGRLSAAETVAVCEPVLAALAAAHHAGLVHRDVKPENVLLADDGRVKVADFGLARAVAEASLTGTAGLLIGTVSYLAPEQVQHGWADARSDVYAVGVMAYELLTGAPPFRGDTPLAVAYRHVHDRVPAPSTRTGGVPAELDRWVLRATSPNPADRPADAGALLTELLGFRHRLPPVRLPDPPAPSTPPTGWPAAAMAPNRWAQPRLGTGTRVLDRTDQADGRPMPAVGSPDSWPPPASAAPPARRRRRRWPWVALPLALVALTAAAAGWYFGTARWVHAPQLLNLDYPQATAAAQRDGLRVHLGPAVFSDTAPAGRIARQSPAAGQRVRSGGTLSVELSLGVERHPVPRLAGDTPAQARAALARVHLGATSAGRYSGSVPSGLVLGSDPPAGTVLKHGSLVVLLISLGPPPVAVPDVVGEPLALATQQLTAAGFRVTTPAATYSDTVSVGSVVSETPAPPARVADGSTVALVLSRGPQLFPVPAVRGMSAGDAVALLRQDGFVPSLQTFPGGPGIVLQQSPAPGSMRRHGSTVTLFVF